MSEHREQVALFNWARTYQQDIPELKMLYAIPNGGHRHKATAAKLKAEGVKAGVWDIALDVPHGKYHGFRGEMKFGTNTLTKNQERWGKWYKQFGYKTAVAYNWSDMADAIMEYLGYRKSSDCE